RTRQPLRRRQARPVLAGLAVAALLAGCGTTVPLASRAQSTNGGALGPGDQLSSSTGGISPGGSSSSGAGSTGTSGNPGALVGGTGTAGGAATTSSTGGATGGGALPPATGNGKASSGFGWDARNVYIGVPTADDFNAAAKNAGANFNNGDVHRDLDAIAADINKNGGILGRKVVMAYRDAPSNDYATNGSVVAQSMCSYFTQDRPVVAVINGFPQLDAQANFHECLKKRSVTLVTLTNTVYSDNDYVRLGPYLFSGASLSTDVLVPTLVSSLKRQGFFSGWDTKRGAPGIGKAKVGLLLPDDAAGRYVGGVFKKQLAGIGEAVAKEYYYPPEGGGNQGQAEVLAFTSAGVTHVLDLPPVELEVALFQRVAETQGYRPRYGITSFDLPLTVEENPTIASPAQQAGSMGIGWQPFNDTNASKDAGLMPGGRRCFAALKAGGQTFSSSARRAALVATQACDGLYLLRDAIVGGQGFTGADILRAMPTIGPRFTPAATFGSVLSGKDRGVPGFFRDLTYDTGCSCFGYKGANRRFAR
ncbi:MAG: hypothetical protein JWO12_3409, partial [Frankiales bacterium]|nr:hypothetical protein [Frankiales bacterium]